MRKLKNSSADQRMLHYNAADVNGKLIIRFWDISHVLRSFHEGRGSQKRILMVLLEAGKITQRELTEILGIQPGSASEVIAKLENAGLIVRISSAEDRRTADVSLTEEGKQRAREASAQRNERNAQMFSCLSEAEKLQLLTLLEKLNRDWEVRYQDTAGAENQADPCRGPYGHHGMDFQCKE